MAILEVKACGRIQLVHGGERALKICRRKPGPPPMSLHLLCKLKYLVDTTAVPD